VVGPSPRSGEAVTPPRSRLSPSPGVGRGGDRLPRSRLSPSLGVGRGEDRLPRSRRGPSPRVGRGGASYGAWGWTLLLSASPWRVAQQSEQAGGAVFLWGQSVEGRSDCGHFGPVDWGTRVRIRCQAILALNAPAIRLVGEAIWSRLLHCEACLSWASGESKVRPLLEEALGRGVNPPGSTVPALGWARARRDRVPWVDGALTCIAPIRPLQLLLMVVTSRV
jgi:hypothetical protein